MLDVKVVGPEIQIETTHYRAAIATEGYTSGVKAGSFVDKRTGAKDQGFGLSIVDFLLEESDPKRPIEDDQYHFGPTDPFHDNIAKRYVEGPQICTQAKKLPYEIIRGRGFIAVKQWFKYHRGYAPYKAGSQWEQTFVFPENTRYFLSADRVTSANDHPGLILRIDMPGHWKHNQGDTFEQVYLSYQGKIPRSEFGADFPPDAKFHYRRREGQALDQGLSNISSRGAEWPWGRIIRGVQTRINGEPGPWLLGMTLAPGDVYEAWCHQRGYICMIEEIGGRPIKKGETFGACYCVGWFDHIEEAEAVYEMHRGWNGLALDGPADSPKAFRGLKQSELPPVRRS